MSDPGLDQVPPGSEPRTSFLPLALQILALALVYFVFAKIGLRYAIVHESITAVWPPTGIALATLLLVGPRVWPGIFLGAFAANLATMTDNLTSASWTAVVTSLGIATGNTLESLLGAYLVNRHAGGRHVFEHSRDVFRFSAFAAVLSTTVSASLGVTSLALGGYASWADFVPLWLTWWLGDASGAIMVTPLIVLWANAWPLHWSWRQLVKIVPLLLLLLVVGQTVFGGLFTPVVQVDALSFLCIPVLVLAAFQFGQCGTATMAALLSVIALWGTQAGHGPFVRSSRNESLMLLQMFMGVVSITALSLSAVIRERSTARKALQQTNELLEDRIAQRTQDLCHANDRLRGEIAERLRVEKELAVDMAQRQRAEKKFRDLLEAAPDAMVIVNRQGAIAIVNAQAERLFGYQRDQLTGQPIEMLVPQGLRARHVEHREQYFRDPHTRPMGQGLELYGVHKNGHEFPVEISLSPLQTEEGVLVSGAIRDISARKTAEKQLQASEARFRRLFDANLIGIVLADVRGHILEANPAFLSMVGYDRAELISQAVCFEGLTPSGGRRLDEPTLERLQFAGLADPWETEFLRKDGGRIAVLVGVAPLEGSPDKCVCFVLDISERKQAEESMRQAYLELDQRVQERTAELARSNDALHAEIAERKRIEERINAALHMKDVLLKEVQHRVKNNLQVVVSLLNLQSGYVRDKQAQELFKESQMRVRCMATIHEKFYQSRELARIDFADYVRNVVRYLQHAYGALAGPVALNTRVHDVFLDIDTAIPCGLIINELVSNALKHAFPNGAGGAVDIDLHKDGNEFVLMVHDNGVGLPAEFDVHTAQSLGLQLVCTLNEQLGGTLEVSKDGGTTFTMRFKDRVEAKSLQRAGK